MAITVDRTGSSQQFADGILKSVPLITDQIEAKARNLTVWLQSHGDEDYDQHPVLLTNGGTAVQAIKDLSHIVFAGGGDAPEHHLSGIEELANSVPWNADPQQARGALLALTTADSKPTGSGRSARELGEALRSRGLLLYLICEPAPQMKELCEGAGGLMFPICNDPDPKEMQKIAGQLSASIVQTIATGGTVPLPV
ncbi:hypothetical protein PM8797T_16760 [Gimesia maris DSM 8797]|nr:hypothetical protein PM8797T_16760 [Gimesia maris DSM 8797]